MIEDHVVDQTRALQGIGGDKAEHHVEKHHQVFSRCLAVTKNVKIFSDRTLTQLRNNKISRHSDVMQKQQLIRLKTKRKRNETSKKVSESRKLQKIIVKEEKRKNYADV